jgi:molecular chaperone DnaJ
MPAQDYYRALGVSRDAADEEIRKAYRKLVFEYHPDRNPGPEGEAKIREINAAYEIIGDPEARRTYDRLRFGDEVRAETFAPGDLLQQMEERLYDEGRKELFAVLMVNVGRIKSELAVIRARTVETQGYDSFKEKIVLDRAAEVVQDFITPEMEAKAKRLLDVAVQMMVSYRVVGTGDEKAVNALRDRFADLFRRGRLVGFQSALEMFYVRR